MTNGVLSIHEFRCWRVAIQNPEQLKYFIRCWEVFYSVKWKCKGEERFPSYLVDDCDDLAKQLRLSAQYDSIEKKDMLHGDQVYRLNFPTYKIQLKLLMANLVSCKNLHFV